MAHPYKQKYNNFNGPGHESPAQWIGAAKKIVEKIGRKLFTKTPKQPKFVPIDSPKGWKKIQETIGKRYVDDAGKLKKFNVATDFVGIPIYGYQVTEGEDKRQMYERNEAVKDNPALNQTRDLSKTIDHFKRGDLD